MLSHDTQNVLAVLKRELEFLDSGGYRKPVAWRSAFPFEDSPSCGRGTFGECSVTCALVRFVPIDRRGLPAPCRHIPLNDAGETVDSLYHTATRLETEAILRTWLVATIAVLENGST